MDEDGRSGHRRSSTSEALRRLLVDNYGLLARKLSLRLGSVERAEDALHDTYVRLERARDLGPIRDPVAYLLRIAANLESNRRTRDHHRATGPDEAALQGASDDAPDPERVAIARSQWAALKRALLALPPRTQEIFLAAWVEETPYSELATKYGVSIRTIQMEVKRAVEYCITECKK